MPTITFEVDVEVEREMLEDDASELSDEELIDEAREIMFSAPAFDGISEYAIANILEPVEVDKYDLDVSADDYNIEATFFSSGVEHKFVFERHYVDEEGPNTAHLDWWEQQGESYRGSLEDVPEFVVWAVEEKYGVELVER